MATETAIQFTQCRRCKTFFNPVLLPAINKMATCCETCRLRNILDGLDLPTPPELLDCHTKHPTLTSQEFAREINKPTPNEEP